MMLVNYRLSASDDAWRVGMMRGQAVVDVSAYVSSDGRTSSSRHIQVQTSQWTAGKALDTFAPMGPGIVPASQIPDPQKLTLVTRVNGQEVQHA